MKLYFIRHTPSGHYLPEPAGRMGRGGSHVEPDPNPDSARIFRSRLSATRALTAWLRGKVYRSSGYASWSNEYYENLYLEPIPSRRREDMEIIEKEIHL